MAEGEFTILVDMDGVLVDINPLIIDRINEKFGTDYVEDDLTSFKYNKNMKQEHADYAYEIWHEDDLYDDIDWSDEAEQSIEKLRELGRVIVVSSPMQGHGTSKLRWLYNHGFDKKDVVLASDKNLVHGHVLIDDRARNVEEFPRATVLVDQPYNKNYQTADHDAELRAKSWNDIINAVKTYHNKQHLIPD